MWRAYTNILSRYILPHSPFASVSKRVCVHMHVFCTSLFLPPPTYTQTKTAAFFNWIANSFIVMSCEVGFFICSWAARFFLQGLFAKVLSYTHTHTLRDTHRHTQTHTHTRYIHTHHTQQWSMFSADNFRYPNLLAALQLSLFLCYWLSAFVIFSHLVYCIIMEFSEALEIPVFTTNKKQS